MAAFVERHPNMTVRFLSRNSSAIAERVRRGELEAGVVLLPIDDDRLEVRPLVRDELLYVSADPERTRRPATIERLAAVPLIFYDAESADSDPIRRLLAERAQAQGVRLRPRVEVEMAELALALVARGLGDTYLPVSYTHAPYYPAGSPRRPSPPPSTTRSPSSPVPPRGCHPGRASYWQSSRRTCTPWRTSSTARASCAAFGPGERSRRRPAPS